MGKRLKGTPRSKVRSALRQVWLRSRERAAALKREKNTCECCGRKASVAAGREFKVEVHHRKGHLDWERILDLIYAELLCDPDELRVLCPDCHDADHDLEEVLR
jgi:hypothetical protein